MKIAFPLTLFLLLGLRVFSQQVTVSGKIIDDNNKAIPFSSVYIKNTTKGTSANSEGEYGLQLKPGTYEVQYKAVGYTQQSRKVELSKNQTVAIALQTETYQLNDVVIKAGGEDAAYSIIRKAIK